MQPLPAIAAKAATRSMKWFQQYWASLNRATWTYHLTPDGWIRDDVAPPDRVETWKMLMRRRALFSTQYRTWWCVWGSPTVSRAERDALRAKYPVDGWLRYQPGINDRIGEPPGDPAVPGRPPPPAAVPEISMPPPMLPPSLLRALAVFGLVVLAVLGGLYLLAPANSYWGAFFAGTCEARRHGLRSCGGEKRDDAERAAPSEGLSVPRIAQQRKAHDLVGEPHRADQQQRVAPRQGQRGRGGEGRQRHGASESQSEGDAGCHQQGEPQRAAPAVGRRELLSVHDDSPVEE